MVSIGEWQWLAACPDMIKIAIAFLPYMFYRPRIRDNKIFKNVNNEWEKLTSKFQKCKN
jgi:hypothetical protein